VDGDRWNRLFDFVVDEQIGSDLWKENVSAAD
jgi:hypothetical protein